MCLNRKENHMKTFTFLKTLKEDNDSNQDRSEIIGENVHFLIIVQPRVGVLD